MAPTPTLPLSLTRLIARQDQPTTTVIVAGGDSGSGSGSGSGLDGGAIAGIVIGTIVGILLLWWVIKSCTGPREPRGPDANRQGWYDDTTEPAPRRRSRSRSTHRHHHHSSHRRHSRHHSSSRRRSTSRPVVYEEKVGYAVPRAPPATYAYPPAAQEVRRSRSRSQGRYYVSG
ncbi:uncharacterized protein B0T15DRAFT_215945 [Chaetomium strumarium]|uniref:Uncharacterized protein n=1 Tax=Chaetomium strumarium TaxID=1170767 RepID=A0AAJ0M271_9PEZI|nr:hypothetical protein B0T15DRAFT_215945 [Chaetomium strumarium]